MASFTKFVCFFFLTTLVFSLQIHARDSQFFSKVSRNRDYTTNPNNNYYINQEKNDVTSLNKQQNGEEQPSYIPQNSQNSFGLYGHDSGLDPSTDTSTSTTVQTTTSKFLYNMDDNKYENQKYNNNDDNNNENYENNQEEESYEPNLERLSDTSYKNGNNVAQNKYNHNNNYKYGDEGKYYGGVGYNGGVEKQGMSDTRYLENGKYFYDIKAEKNLYNNDFSYNNNHNNFNNNNNHGKFYGNNNYYNNQFSEDEFAFDGQP
ncbi:hypothetical protein RND81_06G108100 [Saponaria officinalis]|uniref:Protein E6 n=1 Tax=Saponaria officinalis TaxID=3572 RepID=A0AAW1K9S6_SAPOF